MWAAVGPVWTASLARLAGFPTGGKDDGELLEEIAAKGFTAKQAAVPELQRDESGKTKLTTGEDLYSAGEQSPCAKFLSPRPMSTSAPGDAGMHRENL